MADKKVSMIDILQRVVSLDGKAAAAHERIDKMELIIHDDLSEIKEDFKELSKELKDVIAWMNKGKGWSAAIMLIAGLLGGVFAEMVSLIFKH